MKTIRNWTLAVIIIVIIVAALGATVYLTRRTVTPTFSLAPSTLVAVQGTNVTFTVYGLQPNGVATVYFGDGQEANTTSTLTHAYQDSGRYLVGAEESLNGEQVASTYSALQTLQMTSQINASLAPSISVPTVAFDVDRNPKAPVVQVGDQVYLFGGFLRPPAGNNVTITEYDWNFGNGAVRTVGANVTSLNPLENPATASYVQPGLYPITLTSVTENLTSMATYRTSVEQTIAVGSSSQPYALYLYSGIVPNPTVINEASSWLPPLSFDPDYDYEFGWEVCTSIFSTLLIYNGSSPTNFIPMAAAEIPSVSNGGISPDYTSYTFHIRQDLEFSNGDPLTAYDVYYSIIRDLLYRGSPGAGSQGTPGWLLAQFLVSGGPAWTSIVTNATDTADYNSIVNSMVYSNSSETITFKLVYPVVPQVLFSVLADGLGGGILDSRWLQRIGAGITFNPAGFYAYENGASSMEVQNDPVSSGPYMIQSYTPGQSISLIPNPGFPGVPGSPGIPRANDTFVIEWVKYPETSYELFRSGQADILTNMPPSQYFPLLNEETANGQAKIYQFPTLMQYLIWFGNWGWSGAYNETDMKLSYGTQYYCPTDYFLNLDVRKAFAYSFNYTYYMDNILGNKRYGAVFGSSYAGIGNSEGMPFHVPESELQNVPFYNLTYAKELLQESGEYDTAVNIPFPIQPCYSCGGMDYPTKFAMVQMWAAALHSIDPNIVITPLVENSTAPFDAVLMGVADAGADYPYPSDQVGYWYADSYAPTWLNSTGHPDQAASYTQLNTLIDEADSTTNATLAAQDYKQIWQMSINLYLNVFLYQEMRFYIVKPYMNGYQGQISYLMNPVGYNFYDWWVKTCGSVQACSGRGIGP